MSKYEQLDFFEKEEEQKSVIGDHRNDRIKCFKKLYVSFDNGENVKRFSDLLNQHITFSTNFLWYKGGTVAPEELQEFDESIVKKSNINEFFEKDPERLKFWKEMPQFIAEDLHPFKRVTMYFHTREDFLEFKNLLNQPMTERTTTIWYPHKPITHRIWYRYVNETGNGLSNPKYPIFILSKGRAKCCLTAFEFERIGVPYHVVVEPQEYDEYCKYLPKEKIITTPFSNLGQGGIPSRNFIWELAIKTGAKRHWIMDDNIRHFYRFDNSFKWVVDDGTIFRAAEEFTNRFSNVDLSGLHYDFFCEQGAHHFPYIPNTRIYSCILIKNDLPFRWRGRYNEDTDLSLRVLKRGNKLIEEGHPELGGATILFNAFLAGKMATMTLQGGNMEILYKGDGRLKMAESLKAQHPDVTEVGWRYNRWQHWVDYSQWEDRKLIPFDKDYKFSDEPDNFGMVLKQVIFPDGNNQEEETEEQE